MMNNKLYDFKEQQDENLNLSHVMEICLTQNLHLLTSNIIRNISL